MRIAHSVSAAGGRCEGKSTEPTDYISLRHAMMHGLIAMMPPRMHGMMPHMTTRTSTRRVAAARWRLALLLTAIMTVVYVGFILLIAFNKPLLGTVLMPGLSLGILLGVLVILTAWALIVIYVRWANDHYDAPRRRHSPRPPGGPLSADRRDPTSSRWRALSSSSACRSSSPGSRRGARATPKDFYAAGGSVTALQNGLALAGDYMSAASFLGIAGLVALSGFDGLIYSIGFLVGWPVVVCLIAEPLRNLGSFTFSDVVAFRLRQAPVRVAAAAGSLAVVAFYLIAQMVGAGNLIRLLFGLELRDRRRDRRRGDAGLRAVRRHDRHDVGADRQGGAAADRARSCWRCMVLVQFSFNPLALFGEAATAVRRRRCWRRAAWCRIRSMRISLGLALMFGTAGLPHILMRFYTVPDAPHRARVGGVRDRVNRRVLPAHVHPRLRRDGAGRADGDSRGRRRRQHGGAAAGARPSAARRSSASSPRWRLPRSSRWWPA